MTHNNTLLNPLLLNPQCKNTLSICQDNNVELNSLLATPRCNDTLFISQKNYVISTKNPNYKQDFLAAAPLVMSAGLAVKKFKKKFPVKTFAKGALGFVFVVAIASIAKDTYDVVQVLKNIERLKELQRQLEEGDEKFYLENHEAIELEVRAIRKAGEAIMEARGGKAFKDTDRSWELRKEFSGGDLDYYEDNKQVIDLKARKIMEEEKSSEGPKI